MPMGTWFCFWKNLKSHSFGSWLTENIIFANKIVLILIVFIFIFKLIVLDLDAIFFMRCVKCLVIYQQWRFSHLIIWVIFTKSRGMMKFNSFLINDSDSECWIDESCSRVCRRTSWWPEWLQRYTRTQVKSYRSVCPLSFSIRAVRRSFYSNKNRTYVHDKVTLQCMARYFRFYC